MFSAEEHRMLSQTGRGTPLGEVLRRYWVPALLTEEIPEPDSPPVRVKLMGESLIAFRDSAGKIGLIGEFCAHRGASLFLGRNEDGGLRCSYHGWKYDTTGALTEAPNCLDPSFLAQIQQPAYPCREVGGIVWAYLGPADNEPPLPEFEWLLVPDTQRYASKRIEECNWVQALEVDIDSAHVAYLHRENVLRRAPTSERSRWMLEHTAPTFHIVEKNYGLLIAARRDVDPDNYYWRINEWMMPWYTFTPSEGGPDPWGVHAWVPIDDHTTWVYSFMWYSDRPFSDEQIEGYRTGTKGIFCELVPGTYRPLANPTNDWGMDRAAQKRGDLWMGIAGNQEQDNAITESMGTLYDRTQEHLVGTDAAVIATRRRLLSAADGLAQGVEPFGTDGKGYCVHPVSTVLPRTVDWQEATRAAIDVTPPGPPR
jgi:phenylpropionate dioxygenase-like ring-hydroxylating dioxygenase large terminal subunit